MALSGMEDMGGAMFGFAGGGPLSGKSPSVAEMEQAAQAVLFKKTVVFEKIEIKTYDLGDEAGEKAYGAMLKTLYAGVQAKTHLILLHDKKFVERPKPRWIGHLEWAEYSLKVEANEILKPAEATNG